MKKYDAVDIFALSLLAVGICVFIWGVYLEPPESVNEMVLTHFGDWSPGFVIDGLLLLVLNRVIHNQERRRVISQVGSLSNEFALDAVRRCREENWLQNGVMAHGKYTKARLSTVDLSDANLVGADLSFSDLTHVDLTHANLEGANLKGANFSNSDLRWANLTNADLQWSDFRNAQLDGAILSGANARFASVDKAYSSIPEFKTCMTDGFLSPHQVELVGTSFDLLLGKGGLAMLLFYDKLFANAPHLQNLFTSDTERQARKFLQSLKLIVMSLSSIEKAIPVLTQLGDRHRGYGVKGEHYEIVGATLLETLNELLGDDFTDETREAWAAAFGLISSVMNYNQEQGSVYAT